MQTYRVAGRPSKLSAVIALDGESDYEVAVRFQAETGELPMSIDGGRIFGLCACGHCKSIVYGADNYVQTWSRGTRTTPGSFAYYNPTHLRILCIGPPVNDDALVDDALVTAARDFVPEGGE